jgi:endonuclease III related protein
MMALGRDDAPRKVFHVYALLRGHFGYQHPWWPGSPLEVTVAALLVQQCDWAAAWDAVGRLREAGLLDLPDLAASAPGEVRACIRGVAFAPTKARRLIRLARSVLDRGYRDIDGYLAPDRDTDALPRDLLTLEGIGEETADCLLGFASAHRAFVVDESARRTFRRLGLFLDQGEGFWSQPYGRLKAFFETQILADLSLYDGFTFAPEIPREVALLRDCHAQVVELGKHHCLKTNPCCASRGRNGWRNYPFCESHCRSECSGCPLGQVCRDWGRRGRSVPAVTGG